MDAKETLHQEIRISNRLLLSAGRKPGVRDRGGLSIQGEGFWHLEGHLCGFLKKVLGTRLLKQSQWKTKEACDPATPAGSFQVAKTPHPVMPGSEGRETGQLSPVKENVRVGSLIH